MLDCAIKVVNLIKVVNERLKQSINLQTYEMDDLNQYGRRENIRIQNIPEDNLNADDDGERIVKNVANKFGIQLTDSDIQRAGRIGYKKNGNAKPRPIIARFVSYKKRNQFLYEKAKLKKSETFIHRRRSHPPSR